MVTETGSAMRTAMFVMGVLLPCSLGACAIDPIAIGAQARDGLPTTEDAATSGADGEDGTSRTVGCIGNATPSTSPTNGYLSIDVNGTTRQYILELPTVYDGTTPVPVLFAFHAAGTNAQGFLGQGYGNVRDGIAGRVLLVGPDALVRNGRTAWVDPAAGRGGVLQEDIDFFDALVAQLRANYCIDAGRVFVMGHGDGGIISNQIACVRGDVVRGVGPFSGAGPAKNVGTGCLGKVAAFIGHNPKEGDPVECGNVSGGSCPWILLWAETGWPTTQYWTNQDGCVDPGAMPTEPFAGDGTTGNPPPCTSFVGCHSSYPVTLCLYDYWNQALGPHAFPVQWGARVMTDFFLALPKVP
jgi:poly(3-hydroxybutyrate) depolymerase